MAGKVLVVEDDATLQGVLKYNLTKDGYTVLTAADGLQGLEKARSDRPDLILLDIMLPQMDGLEVCRTLRKEMAVPIILLTARAEEIDKIVGLEIGADDYVTKPFSMRELLARVHAALRRNSILENENTRIPPNAAQNLIAGPLTVDINRHIVTINAQPVELTPKEFDLIAFLVKNRGHLFSREALLEKVWGYDFAGDTRTVDVHIRWLREKIEKDPSNPVLIVTIRGYGYKLEP